jgi:hypothetical protein
MKTNELKINTEKAFSSISLETSAMQRLARSRINQSLLKNYEIDLSNFEPVISTEIDIIQWVRILLFYKQECKYRPAIAILTDLKKIMIGRQQK